MSTGPGTGGGMAISGQSVSGPGVVGQSSDNVGVLGESTFATGVSGVSTVGVGIAGYSTTHVGVTGESDDGRGGVFRGQVAQVRLRPSSRTTHPDGSVKRDLFVDRSAPLVLQGGTNWVRIA